MREERRREVAGEGRRKRERALDAGVVDAEAEPPRVAIGGGDVVDVEEDGRRRRRLARARARASASAARMPRRPRRRGGARRGAHEPPPTRARRGQHAPLHGEFVE